MLLVAVPIVPKIVGVVAKGAKKEEEKEEEEQEKDEEKSEEEKPIVIATKATTTGIAATTATTAITAQKPPRRKLTSWDVNEISFYADQNEKICSHAESDALVVPSDSIALTNFNKTKTWCSHKCGNQTQCVAFGTFFFCFFFLALCFVVCMLNTYP